MFPLHHCHQSQLHAMRDTAVGIWFAYFGQVSCGYTTPRSRPASRPCHIRLQGSAATIGAPAILLEDSRPQAILKFHCPSSLDYRAHPVKKKRKLGQSPMPFLKVLVLIDGPLALLSTCPQAILKL